MGQKVNIALIDKVKDKLSNLVLETENRLEDCSYIDLRAAVSEEVGASTQDGMTNLNSRIRSERKNRWETLHQSLRSKETW